MHRHVIQSRSSINRVLNLQNMIRIVNDSSNGVFAFGKRELSYTREQSLINYGEEVQEARKSNAPIVALESTIITHGMPYPDNLTTAIRVEEIIRQQSVVPATIAIFDGQVHVGMSPKRLEKLAKCARSNSSSSENAIKCSRRDISTIVCQKFNGGTTVGGTVTIARMAGIPIMATGGIGGVHRGAEITLDVSSDLIELSRNPVAVVCAGVKAILDIPKTLEYLETQGVPVITIGDSDNFPAFYSRETSSTKPVKAPSRVSDAREAAELLRTQEILKLGTGMLFAVPIPESHALNPNDVELIIREALEMAEKQGIRGKYVTPYLLQKLNQLTSGGFLKANQALVENNARVAAEMAFALNHLRNNKGSRSDTPAARRQAASKPRPVIVIGGATLDTVLHIDESPIKLDGRTHGAKSRESHGGVGRNIAAALVALGFENTRLISVVGRDDAGRAIAESFGDAGETIEVLSDAITPRYTAILDKTGECRFGIGEMDTFEAIDANFVRKHRSIVEQAGLLVLDGNIPLETMRATIDLAARNEISIWYEPTDVSKASKIFEADSDFTKGSTSGDPILRFISPNVNELVAIAKYLGIEIQADEDPSKNTGQSDFKIEWVSKLAKELAKRVPVVIITLGAHGILIARRGSMQDPLFDPSLKSDKLSQSSSDATIKSRWYPAPAVAKRDANEKFSVSGCGDCLAAAIIIGSYRGLNEAECVSFALQAAAVSLRSHEPVPRTLEQLRNFAIPTNAMQTPRALD